MISRAGVQVTKHAQLRWGQRTRRPLHELPTAAARAWCLGACVPRLFRPSDGIYASLSEGLVWIFQVAPRRLLTLYPTETK